ncbi:hypothetical protein SP5_010_00090 [Sphingomonas parapaucimobilis NBRC 15100]|uniref:Uncharacterized protein n=1 Tax=Sphingomonas parapaucimobilis NBRC 15100 TaxID=1219049 RepID=A0A0A1W4A1_9SPHN|nr:hypothetical protein SP5_010_00090 [Sphingomonas parapaucimobilis NBRC 15100]
MRTAPGPKIPSTDKAPEGAAGSVGAEASDGGGMGTGVWAMSGAARATHDNETESP